MKGTGNEPRFHQLDSALAVSKLRTGIVELDRLITCYGDRNA